MALAVDQLPTGHTGHTDHTDLERAQTAVEYTRGIKVRVITLFRDVQITGKQLDSTVMTSQKMIDKMCLA